MESKSEKCVSSPSKLASEFAANRDKMSKEQIHLLSIFPAEVWSMIFEPVQDSETLQNIHDSSLYLRGFLQDKRIIYLFPDVWNIFLGFYSKVLESNHKIQVFQMTRNGVNEAMRYCDSCGKYSSEKYYSAILELRLVCKSWTKAMDSLYNSALAQTSKAIHEPDYINYEFEAPLYSNNLEYFVGHFSASHGTGSTDRNPFLGRALDIPYEYAASRDRAQRFLDLLTKYGKHVWYCKLEWTDEDLDGQLYRTLRRWLELMPNLKEFYIEYVDSEEMEPHLLQELQDEINFNGFPKLENLNYLYTQALPESIFNEIIRKSENLSKLEVYGNIASTDTIPNLRELGATLYTTDHFANIEQGQWNAELSKISLDFQCHPTDSFVEWPRLFSWLESKWGRSLTDVKLSLPEPTSPTEQQNIITQCKSLRLNLPFVKHFGLTLRSYASLDFILPMSGSLEELDIIVNFSTMKGRRDYPSVEEEQIIQFIGFTDRILDSNIWKLFSKLRVIRYGEYSGVCTYNARDARQRWKRNE